MYGTGILYPSPSKSIRELPFARSLQGFMERQYDFYRPKATNPRRVPGMTNVAARRFDSFDGDYINKPEGADYKHPTYAKWSPQPVSFDASRLKNIKRLPGFGLSTVLDGGGEFVYTPSAPAPRPAGRAAAPGGGAGGGAGAGAGPADAGAGAGGAPPPTAKKTGPFTVAKAEKTHVTLQSPGPGGRTVTINTAGKLTKADVKAQFAAQGETLSNKNVNRAWREIKLAMAEAAVDVAAAAGGAAAAGARAVGRKGLAQLRRLGRGAFEALADVGEGLRGPKDDASDVTRSSAGRSRGSGSSAAASSHSGAASEESRASAKAALEAARAEAEAAKAEAEAKKGKSAKKAAAPSAEKPSTEEVGSLIGNLANLKKISQQAKKSLSAEQWEELNNELTHINANYESKKSKSGGLSKEAQASRRKEIHDAFMNHLYR